VLEDIEYERFCDLLITALRDESGGGVL